METKVCKTCGEEKPIDEFYKTSKTRKDGTPIRNARCAACLNKAQWEKNKDDPAYKERHEQWEKENKERRYQYHAEWEKNNKELLREYQRKANKKQWEKKKALKPPRQLLTEEEKKRRNKESQKKWRAKNAEKAKEIHKAWREENIERTSGYWKKYNTERRRAKPEYAKARNEYHRSRVLRVKQVGGSHTIAQWEALKAQHNYTCLCCGRQEPEIKLTRDHIVAITKGGTDDISNIQPLCGPCNSKKQTELIDFRAIV